MTATGDGPLDADTAPSADRANAEAVHAGPDLPRRSAKPDGGGRSAKARKHRRRRRGPVYAQGLRPVLLTGRQAPGVERAGNSPAVIQVDGKPAVEAEPQSYAALDLGTNNCRLLVAKPREHGFRVTDAFSRIVRLGEGIGQTGRLGEAAMMRAIEALKICGGKLREHRVVRSRLIATEACRSAANGAEFVARVKAETDLTLEIISSEAEAKLAVAGCSSLVDQTAAGVILFDIGGGSSELVWIDLATPRRLHRRRIADCVRSWMSLPVGVVNLSERHGGRNVTPEQFEAMVTEVAAMLGHFPEASALDAVVAGGRIHLLGTSGTVTTLAGVHLDLPRYDRRRVDGTWLTNSEVIGLVARLNAMDYEARITHPCIGRERADLVLAGCAILEAFRRRWPCGRLRVADRGLREGVLVELMAEDGVWRPRPGRDFGKALHG